jgi:hypothetical protein
MRRREVLGWLTAAFGSGSLGRAFAQDSRADGSPAVIGVTSVFSRADSEPWHAAFR